MFIYVAYKDAPELSSRRSVVELVDTSVEKSLLVNPDCPVRIMLEYIRKKCRLGSFTQFDLCDESGILMGLFALNTYEYATDQFEHKKVYYVIVLKLEADKHYTVLPQLNLENKLYYDLQMKVKRYMVVDELHGTVKSVTSVMTKKLSPEKRSPGKRSSGKVSPGKTSPASPVTSAKGSGKKK